MEEKKNKNKKNHWSWFKKNWRTLAEAAVFITETAIAWKLYGDLEKENQKLQSENTDLRGQIYADERENRRLSRENGNLNFQLGKMVASKKQQ